MRTGERMSPRGLLTLDAGYTTFVLTDPTKAAVVGIGRKLSIPLASAETTQLISGMADVKQLTNITPVFSRFDVNDRQPGAYGPRIHDQLPQVIRELSTDGDTRRAQAVIWRNDDLFIESPDVPCTVMFGWAIRNGKLEMYTHMRSNDLWLGVPYDVIMMTRLQLTLAWALGVEPGPYYHTAASLHLYVDDLDKTKQLHEPGKIVDCPVPPFTPSGRDNHWTERSAETALNRWIRARTWARQGVSNYLGTSQKYPHPENATWHRDTLAQYRSDGLFCPGCYYVLPRTSDHFHSHLLDNKWKATCKRCRNEIAKKSPEQMLAARCAWYGVTVEWYHKQVELQKNLCATCQRPPDNGRYRDFHIDHCHETGEVRGLLCSNCNVALGLVDDDEERLDRMMKYLRGELYE